MSKLSIRRFFAKTHREKKTLNPEMRKLLNSYEPLHPEQSAEDGDESAESPDTHDDERRSAA
jgi:hypothetical protein